MASCQLIIGNTDYPINAFSLDQCGVDQEYQIDLLLHNPPVLPTLNAFACFKYDNKTLKGFIVSIRETWAKEIHLVELRFIAPLAYVLNEIVSFVFEVSSVKALLKSLLEPQAKSFAVEYHFSDCSTPILFSALNEKRYEVFKKILTRFKLHYCYEFRNNESKCIIFDNHFNSEHHQLTIELANFEKSANNILQVSQESILNRSQTTRIIQVKHDCYHLGDTLWLNEMPSFKKSFRIQGIRARGDLLNVDKVLYLKDSENWLYQPEILQAEHCFFNAQVQKNRPYQLKWYHHLSSFEPKTKYNLTHSVYYHGVKTETTYGYHQAHEPGSQVLVGFLNGSVVTPIILGALSSPEQTTVVTCNNDTDNLIKTTRSAALNFQQRLSYLQSSKNFNQIKIEESIEFNSLKGSIQCTALKGFQWMSENTHIQKSSHIRQWIQEDCRISSLENQILFKANHSVRLMATNTEIKSNNMVYNAKEDFNIHSKEMTWLLSKGIYLNCPDGIQQFKVKKGSIYFRIGNHLTLRCGQSEVTFAKNSLSFKTQGTILIDAVRIHGIGQVAKN